MTQQSRSSRSRFHFAVSCWGLVALFGCAAAGPGDGDAVGQTAEAACKGVKLAMAPSGLVATGVNVALSASSTTCGATETAEYRFTHRRDGTSTDVEIQPYAASTSATLDTALLPSGKYSVKVSARAALTAAAQSSASATLLVGSVCNKVALGASPAAPQPAGHSVSVTGTATCTSGAPEYRFSVKPTGASAYTLVRDWGVSVASIDTTGFAAGLATLQVQARAQGNASSYESQGVLSYRIGEQCSALSVASAPSTPAPGTPVTVTASATCTGAATPVYRFSYRASGAPAFTTFRDWGGSPATWDTASLPVGTYQLKTELRASDYAGTALATKTVNVALGGTCTAATLAITPTSPAPTASLLSLTAGATCSGGLPEFRFLRKGPSDVASAEFQAWGAGAATFDTTGAGAGPYTFTVQVRTLGATVPYQVQKALNYQIGDVCNSVTLAAAPAGSASVGTVVALTGKATCRNGGSPEYAYYARLAGAPSWSLLRDYGPGSFAWATPGLTVGAYQVRVDARGQGHTGPPESTRNLNYTLTPCSGGVGCGCAEPSDCPAPTTECSQPTCVGGVCGTATATEGSPCDDGDACTQSDGCSLGACVGTAVSCAPLDDCHSAGVCAATGVCTNPVVVDGTACDAIVSAGECRSGTCAAFPQVSGVSPPDGASAPATTSLVVTFTTPMVGLTAQTVAGACVGSLQVSVDGFATCIALAAGTPAMSVGDTVATLAAVPGLLTNRTYRVRVATSAVSAAGPSLPAEFTSGGFSTTSPNTCDGSLVVSQLYTAGASTGGTYQNDYVHVFNRGSTSVSLAGWSLQYASAVGTSWQVHSLTGTVLPPGGSALIAEAGSINGGSLLPPAAQFGLLTLSNTAGKLALVHGTTALTGACPVGGQIVDFVRYGPGSSPCVGGAAPAPGLFTALFRAAGGCAETGDHSTDFASAVAAPFPPATHVCACGSVNETDGSTEADFCAVVAPSDLVATSGASTTVFAQVYEAGVTEGAGANASVHAEVGYGPLASNPEYEAGWVWSQASFGSDVVNGDQYAGSFTAPAAGSYRYAFRFSLDHGVSYTYCDRDSGDLGAGSNVGLTFDLPSVPLMSVAP